jgi:hypothetical protein
MVAQSSSTAGRMVTVGIGEWLPDLGQTKRGADHSPLPAIAHSR